MTEKAVINIDDVPLIDRGNGKQFAVKWGRAGPLIGLNGLGCAVHVVPPGKKAFPFHRHHVADELFFVEVKQVFDGVRQLGEAAGFPALRSLDRFNEIGNGRFAHRA